MDRNAEWLGRMPSEKKVAIAIDMTDACMRICADGIRTQYPGIGEDELVEKLRERLDWAKRGRKGER